MQPVVDEVRSLLSRARRRGPLFVDAAWGGRSCRMFGERIGGIFCFTLRSNCWENGLSDGIAYKDVIDELVADGKMEYLHGASKDYWRGREEGTGLFARQRSKVFALRKVA